MSLWWLIQYELKMSRKKYKNRGIYLLCPVEKCMDWMEGEVSTVLEKQTVFDYPGKAKIFAVLL